jgi:hypothetical protein
MDIDADRSIAVLTRALSVCRGLLYSARTGDATVNEIDLILESTAGDSMNALLGEGAYSHALRLAESLPREDVSALLGVPEAPV